MASLYVYTLTSVFLVSLVSFVGLFTLSIKEMLLRRVVFVLVSLAAGALLGDAFIHLVPEAFTIIAAGFLVSTEVGVATTLAIVLHEIPQEIGDFAVLLYSGFSRWRALFLNFLSALVAVLGALLVLMLGEAGEAVVLWLIPIAAGGSGYMP